VANKTIKTMTIDDLISELMKFAETSPYGSDTPVFISTKDQEGLFSLDFSHKIDMTFSDDCVPENSVCLRTGNTLTYSGEKYDVETDNGVIKRK
jgi:hypothetical protein